METAASVAGLIQVTIEALAAFKAYISAVKVAPESARRLELELTAINQALSKISKSSGSDQGVVLDPAVASILPECEATLQRMLEDFRVLRLQDTHGMRGLTRRLKWPSREKKIMEWVMVLERYKSTLSLNLNTSTNVGVKLLQDNERIKDFETRRKTLNNWLSPLPYNVKHEVTSHAREPNTGEWLFQKSEYVEWEIATGRVHALWMKGIPGCGKSFLASNIIDRLLTRKGNGDELVIYCYCDFSNYPATVPQNIIRTLLVQMLVRWQVDSPELFEDLFSMIKSGQGPPSHIPTLVALTRRFLQLAPGCTYIIIDALDECNERELLLDYLVGLTEEPGVRVFVTGRGEQDIEDKLTPTFGIISLVDEQENLQKDMQLHLQQELLRKKWNHVQGDMRTELINTLLKDSERNMFRWLQCQLDVLSKTKTNNGLRRALKDLPRDLFRVYERILESIGDESKELVQKALLWLATSHQPMKLPELVEALKIVEGEPKLDHDATVNDPLDLVRICGSLVKYDSYSTLIFLSHLTVKEFLYWDQLKNHPTLSNYRIIPEEASSTLAKLTLTYLLLEDFDSGACATPHEFEKRRKKYPCYIYCIQTFYKYVNAAEDDRVFDLVWTFLNDRIPQYRSFQQAHHWVRLMGTWKILKRHWKKMQTLEPMHYVVSLEMAWVAKRIIQQHPELLEAEISTRGTPLFMATRDSLTEMVKLFLSLGANIHYGANTPNERTPLLVAANNGNEQIFRILLGSGSDLNVRGRGDMHAIHEVAPNSPPLLSFILKQGINPNIRCGRGSTPLHYAVSGGRMESVKILIAAGADIFARNNVGETPLHLALSLRLVLVLDYLLELVDDFSPLEDDNETLTVSDISWAKSKNWYSKLYDGIAKAHSARGNVQEVEISGIELSKLRLGFIKATNLPPAIVMDIFDLASLWAKSTVSKHDPVAVSEISPRVPYIAITIHRPLRRVVVQTRSHDQGFSGDKEAQGSYRGSWTWFEAGIQTKRLPKPEIFRAPRELHCNVHASLTFRDHRTVLDFNDPTPGVREWLGNVNPGDVLKVFAMAKFPAWVNYVDMMKVDVFCA